MAECINVMLQRPPLSMVSLSVVRYHGNCDLDADDSPLTWGQEVIGSLMLRQHACVIPLTSSHHVGILSHRREKGEYSAVGYFETVTTFT